jgi:hypothetical protein
MKKFILIIVTLYFGLVIIFNFNMISTWQSGSNPSEGVAIGVALFEQPLILVLSVIPGIGVGGVHISVDYMVHESKVIILVSFILLVGFYIAYFYSVFKKKKLLNSNSSSTK